MKLHGKSSPVAAELSRRLFVNARNPKRGELGIQMKLNKVTSILGIAVFTIAFGSSAFGQSAGQTGSVPPAQTSVAKTKHPLLNALNLLNLTQDQKAKVNRILDNRDRDNKIFKKTETNSYRL